MIKKIDSIDEVSGLAVKGQRERSKSKGQKEDPDVSSSNTCYYSRKLGHVNKNCIKYKEMLKKKGGKDSDGASRKADQVEVVEQADKDPCDVLTAQSGKYKYSDAWLLDSGFICHMCPKRE